MGSDGQPPLLLLYITPSFDEKVRLCLRYTTVHDGGGTTRWSGHALRGLLGLREQSLLPFVEVDRHGLEEVVV